MSGFSGFSILLASLIFYSSGQLSAQPYLYMTEDSVGGHVSVFNAATGVVEDRIQINESGSPTPVSVLFHPDGRRVIVGLCDGDAVELIDRSCRCVVDSLTFTDRYQDLDPAGMAFLPGSEFFYVALSNDNITMGTVAKVAVEPFEEVERVALPGFPAGVAASPDGMRVFVTNGDPNSPSLSVIDTATNQVVAEASYGDPFSTLRDVAITADGQTIYAAQIETDSILKINAQSLELEHSIQTSPGLTYFTLSANDKYLFAGGGSHSSPPTVDRVNLATLESEAVLTLEGLGPVTGVEAEPVRDNLYVMIVNEDRVDVVDLPSFSVSSSLTLERPISEGFVSRLRIGGDGRDLKASNVLCWNLTTGDRVVGTPVDPAWDCASMGLSMNSGDEIITAVGGTVP